MPSIFDSMNDPNPAVMTQAIDEWLSSLSPIDREHALALLAPIAEVLLPLATGDALLDHLEWVNGPHCRGVESLNWSVWEQEVAESGLPSPDLIAATIGLLVDALVTGFAVERRSNLHKHQVVVLKFVTVILRGMQGRAA